MTITPVSIDMYLPAFLKIARELGTRPGNLTLTISGYFVGLAIGQIFYGPLLDRYGWKRPLRWGALAYLFSSLGCAFAPSLDALVAFRFFQAIGGGVAGVVAVALVRDLFARQEAAGMLSLLTVILGASPLLAPSLGNVVLSVLGWRGIFLVQMVFAAIVITFGLTVLPGGSKPDREVPLRPRSIVKTYAAIAATPGFLRYALAGCLSFAPVFILVAGSPDLFMRYFHVDPQSYAMIFGLLSLGWVGSNQLNALLVRRFDSDGLLVIGLTCQAAVAVTFLIGALGSWCGLVTSIVLFFFSLSFVGLALPNASAGALSRVEARGGSAAALLGVLQTGIAATVTAILGGFPAKNLVLVAAALAISALLARAMLLGGAGREAPDRNGMGMTGETAYRSDTVGKRSAEGGIP